MTGYQRFVAYVYEYRKGKKGENCGFLKVEDRNGNCRMEIRLKCAGLTAGLECRVYGFVRKQGELQGILLGVCETQENKLEGELEMASGNLHGSGVSLKELGGMAFRLEGGGFYGTEWDDEPIQPELFVEMPDEAGVAQPEPEKKMENSGEPNGETEEKNGDRQEPVVDAGEKEERETEAGDQDREKERADSEKQMDEGDGGKLPEDLQERTEEKAEEEETLSSEKEEKDTEEAPGESGVVMEEVCMEEEGQPEQQKTDCGERQASDKAEAVRNPFGFDPFGDGEIIECRKIRPNDIGAFNRRDWSLRNNKFLLYGYYQFGHLLLGRLKDGQYILGVPGLYDQQERFMANMFGFPHFKYSPQVELPQGKGGYWYRLIYPPNFR